MASDLDEIIKKVVKTKWFSVLIILIISIALGIFVWQKFNFLTEVSFTLKKQETQKQKEEETIEDRETCCPDLKLGYVLVPPAPKKLPIVVVFQVENPGEVTTRQVRVFIDFGSSKVIDYEVIGPKEDSVSGSEPGTSVINLEIKRLMPHESAYIYVQTSHAVFSKIALSSSDTLSVIEYDYKEYLAHNKSDVNSIIDAFMIFLLILAIVVIGILTFYFLIILIKNLNKWLKVKWD